MTPLVLSPTPLFADAFAPFGTVLEAEGKTGFSVNNDWAQRIDQDPAFAHTTGKAAPSVAIYRNRPRTLPVEINEVERHSLSSQLFMPVMASRWLVVVVPDDAAGEPDMARTQAFLATGRQGVCYRPGAWHGPLMGLDTESEFFMLMWSLNPAEDTEVRAPDRAVQIRLD